MPKSGIQPLAQGGKAARKHILVLTEHDLSLLLVKLSKPAGWDHCGSPPIGVRWWDQSSNITPLLCVTLLGLLWWRGNIRCGTSHPSWLRHPDRARLTPQSVRMSHWPTPSDTLTVWGCRTDQLHPTAASAQVYPEGLPPSGPARHLSSGQVPDNLHPVFRQRIGFIWTSLCFSSSGPLIHVHLIPVCLL